LSSDTAFVTVKASAASSSTIKKSQFSTMSSESSFRVGWGWFSASGSTSSSSTSQSSSSATVSESSSLEFSLARVLITRPWLDTSMLSFYPVAIRNLAINGWSDGAISPAKGQTQFKFKLLPVAMLVARNILVSNMKDEQSQDFVAASSSSSSSLRVSYGPFFSGSTSTSSANSNRDYKEKSNYSAGSLSIRGPQIIGWVCTPVPPFPTSDESGVRKWEAEQIQRQNIARNSTATNATTATK